MAPPPPPIAGNIAGKLPTTRRKIAFPLYKPKTSGVDLCNPLTRKFTIFPSLGSAWCQHGTVVPSSKTVIVLTELAVLSLGSMGLWRNFSSGLCSKPRSLVLTVYALWSPVLTVYALSDVGSPWRSQWKLRRRLVRGPRGRLLTVGSLKSSHAVNSQCSAVIILRLDLESLEWDEAAMMPLQIFESLEEVGSGLRLLGVERECSFRVKG
ncbi:hypothetical protein AMTR_s00030p00096820 [Amborella trichopoda]|uniref:Uncharacterized protein n=1 Tax=Amborella trichopoda TaxID=13333 RepID=U5D3Q9_AMBTC|nr:hypothetical protein AMTR_s00030p00096820 [Amborella trichopoda]